MSKLCTYLPKYRLKSSELPSNDNTTTQSNSTAHTQPIVIHSTQSQQKLAPLQSSQKFVWKNPFSYHSSDRSIDAIADCWWWKKRRREFCTVNCTVLVLQRWLSFKRGSVQSCHPYLHLHLGLTPDPRFPTSIHPTSNPMKREISKWKLPPALFRPLPPSPPVLLTYIHTYIHPSILQRLPHPEKFPGNVCSSSLIYLISLHTQHSRCKTSNSIPLQRPFARKKKIGDIEF